MPVPTGTRQTSPPVHWFGMLFATDTLSSMTFSSFTCTSRKGSAKVRIPPVLPVARLRLTVTPELFSTSKPLTFACATFASTRMSRDCPT